MKTDFTKKTAFFLIAIMFFINYCQHEVPVQRQHAKPCIDDQPVEDTTRVYLSPETGDTLLIAPKLVYARFYPWVKDTTKILRLLEKHHLRLRFPLSDVKQQIAATLCVTDNRRAEYHFTPYGKEGFCNFGADSLVEYAFAMFHDGHLTFDGNIIFRFEDNTPQARIDSLFDAKGLRFIHTSPDIPAGNWYVTLVTPRSSKNVLDLTYELKFVPFVRFVFANFGTRVERLLCE